MSQMLKSSSAMASATMLSRVLGLVREMAYAGFMGTGPIAGAFFFAFMIPNLFRRLLGEGALSAAFIPIFKGKEKREGHESMWRAANSVISGLLGASCLLILAVWLAISAVLLWWPLTLEFRLMLELLRITFPYLLLVCLAALFMGMLNALGFFFIPAMGATMLNLVMIAAVFLVTPFVDGPMTTKIFVLAWAVLVAGVIQVVFQLPLLRKQGFRFQWISPKNNPVVREVVEKMIPGTIGVAAFQINMLITTGLAYWHDPVIVGFFNYSVRLMELPQGVFGISLATFLLPTLSGLAAEKDFNGFRTTLRQGLGHMMFINSLASVLLVILAEPMIRLLFERGQFTAYDTQHSGFALACLAPGLVMFSIVNILARAFYALGDTRTPMLIASFCLVVNIFFAAWLIFPLREGGLGLANTMSSTLNVGLLLFALRKKLKTLEMSELKRDIPGLLTAAIAAGCVAWLGLQVWTREIGHQSLWHQVGEVFVPLILASGIYWLICIAMNNRSSREIWQFVRKRSNS